MSRFVIFFVRSFVAEESAHSVDMPFVIVVMKVVLNILMYTVCLRMRK